MFLFIFYFVVFIFYWVVFRSFVSFLEQVLVIISSTITTNSKKSTKIIKKHCFS